MMEDAKSGRVTVKMADLSYRLELSRPLFELIKQVPEVLAAWYTSVSPRFYVDLSGMQALPGPSVAECGARLTLFGGIGTAVLKPDRLECNFSKMRSVDDIKVSIDCISLLRSPLNDIFTDLRIREARIELALWFSLEGGRRAAVELVNKLAPNGLAEMIHSTDELGQLNFSPRVHFTLSEGDGLRSANMLLDLSAINDADLFVSYIETLGQHLAAQDIEVQSKLIEDRLTSVLKSIDVQL